MRPAWRQPPRPSRPQKAAPASAHPVNDVLPFLDFVEHHPVGSSVNGVVDSYSSHGAYISIGDVRGYVPLRLMSDPPPRSAREVMRVGDAVTLVVISFAPARRSVDLAVPAMAPGADLVATPELEELAEAVAAPAARGRRAKTAALPAPVEAAPAASAEAPAARPARSKRAAKKATAEPAAKKAAAKKAATKKAPAEARRRPSRRRPRRRRRRRRRPKKAAAKKAAAKKTAAKKTTDEPVATTSSDGAAVEPSSPARAPVAPAIVVRIRLGHRCGSGRRHVMTRLATWNINSVKVRQERLEQWLTDVAPDVVCLQETKVADSAFPQLAFEALGYAAAHHGEGRWNGVAILSRKGLEDVSFGFADGAPPDAEARLMTATCDGIKIINVYVPNGRALDADHYQYKLGWLDRLAAHLDAVAQPDEPVILTGDFNIAPADADVYDPAKYIGTTHTSEPERSRLSTLLEWGLTDVFRAQHADAQQVFSWWDYRRR